AVVRPRGAELSAGADTELGEHLAQVPLDGLRADVQLRRNLMVRAPPAGEPGDLLLSRGKLGAGLVTACAHLLSRGQKLAPGPFGEGLHADPDERLVGST